MPAKQYGLMVDDGVPHLKPNEISDHKKNWKSLQVCISSYEKVGFRNTYLFDWLLYMFENLHFSCVDKKYLSELAQAKTMISMYDVMVDDIADRKEERSDILIDALLNIPFNSKNVELRGLSEKQIQYYKETKNVWNQFLKKIEGFPRQGDMKKIIDFDILQLLNSMRYSFLANNNKYMANSIENREYGSHSMLIIVQGTLDIMCSPKFDIRELGKTRRALIYAQRMGRIGQMISTWAKEIVEKDITNDLFVDSFEDKVISVEGLDTIKDIDLLKKFNERISKYELEYNELYAKLKNSLAGIRSFNTTEFLKERDFIHEKYHKRCHYWLAKYEKSLHTVG